MDKTGLALGPAERADVIVDFSAYAGKTLILYNDAPAAWPARVPGYDYYTGAPDMRDSGGYGAGGVIDPATGAWVVDPLDPNNVPHGILPGYAPNTRTVMQIIVRAGTPEPFNPVPLENEFTSAAPATALNPAPTKTLFERTQEPIIVGQAAYSSAYPNSYFPSNFPWEGVTQINDEFLQFVTLAGEKVRVPTEPKGIHDEMGASFDPEFGRMSGNLSMQLKNASTLNALLVLYGFSDIPTEKVNNSTSLNVEVLPNPNPALPGSVSDGTQIWKISHNGVDTHPIHFHIFDVQLINRVGWDGQIALPEANELGWKDTVKISPLMDTIVAVRPRAPALPFGIPNSLRPLNPAIPIDSAMDFTTPTPGSDLYLGTSFLPPNTPKYGFNSVDWNTGEAYVFSSTPEPYPYNWYKGIVTNVLYNFGWEYVWHCHILSHEEMDMMRPIVLNVETALPPAFSAMATPGNGRITVTWNDPTPVDYTSPATFGDPANEVGFNVYRSIDGVDFTKLNDVNLPANSTSFEDTSPVLGSIYKVEAFNAKGSTFTSPVSSTVVTVSVRNLPLSNAPAAVDLGASVNGLPAGITVASVDFYNGATLLGSDTTSPYRYNWTNVMGGVYSVTARITDSRGVVTTSAPLGVLVTGTLTADFSISGSASGSDIGFCENVTLNSNTSTGAGIDGWSWSTGGGASTETLVPSLPGTYPVTLTVSNSGTGETASVTKNVVIVNHNPTAIPGGPYTVAPGGSVTLNGSGTDPLDPCNTSPMSYAWNLDNKGNGEIFTASATIAYNTAFKFFGYGTHPITLQVTDANGGVATATTTITVYGLPPTVALTAPATGSSYNSPASITLAATATADTTATIASVDFYNGTTKIGTGVLSGGVYSFTWTVNTGGTYSLRARATDSWGSTADSAAVQVSVSGISTVLLPDGVVNSAYNQTMSFYGGTAPFSWSATGLPTGLTIDPATGIISGAPAPSNITAPALFATFPVSIAVQDSSATPLTANALLNLTINQALPAAPSGLTVTASPVNQIVLAWTDNANNESGFRIERATDNTFTTGLTTFTINTVNLTSFTDTAVVAGTTYYYRVKSFNNLQFSSTYSNTLMVALPVITTTSLPNGGVNAAYSTIVTASGGNAPYTWSATGLPAGLSINPASGLISGTPANVVAAFVVFPVTITVQDSLAASVTTTLNLRINQTAPAAPSALAANATAATRVVLTWADNASNESMVEVQRATDVAFSANLTSVKITGTALTGYTDNTVVSGTTYYYRVRSGNSFAFSVFSNTATLTTPVPVSITTASLANGAVNVAYNQTVTAINGIAPYTWSATGLPTGLSINPATGVISGTPANVVATFVVFPVTITVQDASAIPSTASVTLNLRVNQTAPAAPSALAANATAATQVVLTWADNASNESMVEVQRATDAAFSANLTSVKITGTALTGYTDNTVVSGTTYYYRVRSGNSFAFSVFSNTAQTTTP